MITAPLSRTVPSKNGATMVVRLTEWRLPNWNQTKTTIARQIPTRSAYGKTIPKILQFKLFTHAPLSGPRLCRDTSMYSGSWGGMVWDPPIQDAAKVSDADTPIHATQGGKTPPTQPAHPHQTRTQHPTTRCDATQNHLKRRNRSQQETRACKTAECPSS